MGNREEEEKKLPGEPCEQASELDKVPKFVPQGEAQERTAVPLGWKPHIGS